MNHEIQSKKLQYILIIGLVTLIFFVAVIAGVIIIIYYGQKQGGIENLAGEDNDKLRDFLELLKPQIEVLAGGLNPKTQVGRSGRMGVGNQLGLYCYMYLKALDEGVEFIFDEKFADQKKVGYEIFQVFPNLERHRKSTGKMVVPEIEPYRNIKPLFGFSRVHDIKLYQNYRGLLRQALGIRGINWNGFDVTVHLRFKILSKGLIRIPYYL